MTASAPSASSSSSAPAATAPVRSVRVLGERITLDAGQLLGAGGEAQVFAHPHKPLAIKLYHARPQGLAAAQRKHADALAALRVRKLESFPAGLDSAVAAPVGLAHDDAGAVVGYAMPRVPRARDIAVLARRPRALDVNAVLAVFAELRRGIDALHARGVVVGDLNDGNVVLDDADRPHMIDADSMQLGGLPCPVAHERFLDPQLYGADLAAAPRFSVQTDLYALRVLLCQSLLGVHPYGGVVAGLPTLLRRAEAGHSIFRGDVTLPRAAAPLLCLPDDVLEDFRACFEGGARVALPPAVFARAFTECACGCAHARARCPACSVAVAVPAPRVRGAVEVTDLLRERVTVVHAEVVDGTLRMLLWDGRTLRREDGQEVGAGPLPADACVMLGADVTWIGVGSTVVGISRGAVVQTLHTRSVNGAALVALVGDVPVVVHDDALVHTGSGRRLGRVLRGQCRLFGGPRFGAGVMGAGRIALPFVFDTRGITDVHAPALCTAPGARLFDVGVRMAADGSRALFGFAVALPDANGTVRVRHALSLVDSAGCVLATAEGDPERDAHTASIHGACVTAARVLMPTSTGVVALHITPRGARTGSAPSDARAPGTLAAATTFAETAPFVDAGCALFSCGDGALCVVSPSSVQRLTLRP